MDDIEALRPEKELYFSLTEIEKQDQAREAYTCWAITGEQIDTRFHPDSLLIDYDREQFLVTYDGHLHDLRGRQNKTFEWALVPLKSPRERGIELFNANNMLLIFEWPEEGFDYGLGVDNSGGTKQDNSVVVVNRHSLRGAEPDKIAAIFTSNTINPAMMHSWVMAMAALYRVDGMPHGEPVVGIEQVYGMGDVTQNQMLAMGYKRFYKFSRLDGVNPNKDKRKSKRLGWFTHDWSRNFMLSLFKNAVENHWYQLNDPFLIKQELPSFQASQSETGRTKFEAAQGKRDDRIFAAGIAFVVLNDTESMARRVEKPFTGSEGEEIQIDYSFPVGYNATYDQVAEELGLET